MCARRRGPPPLPALGWGAGAGRHTLAFGIALADSRSGQCSPVAFAPACGDPINHKGMSRRYGSKARGGRGPHDARAPRARKIDPQRRKEDTQRKKLNGLGAR